ncbi:MAG: RNA methyltransferase [Candidatus Marinimicrobia bacterium]|nr:RNA methyltransferase [Candidatus Neomarinimicrobiota bacterium]
MKRIRSLSQKKIREVHELFIVEGLRSVSEALNAKAPIKSILWTKEFSQKNAHFIKTISTDQNEAISTTEMKHISPASTPPGLLAVCKIPTFKTPKMNRNFIFLDHVSDPGNMGTILRTALWFGIQNIALSEGCIDPFNPKVVRGAMGAHFHLSWIGTMHINDFKDYTILGADHQGDSIQSVKIISNKWVLVMGSEAHGINENLKPSMNQLVAIPKIGSGDSLNVGVAMGILLHHLTAEALVSP